MKIALPLPIIISMRLSPIKAYTIKKNGMVPKPYLIMRGFLTKSESVSLKRLPYPKGILHMKSKENS